MPGRGRSVAVLALAAAAYLALSVLLWWDVWSSHPTSVTTCGCGDPALFTWFLAWPAHALAHGHDPFFSTAINAPTGINLLANTSVLAIGVVLAPVTWLFGPVATFNVASTVTPALSALAMCWLLRRWVRFDLAAFAGGLLFGFSPFVVTNLLGGHLMTSALVVLPLLVGALDELVVRQRHRSTWVGMAVGLLLVVQFFTGTEIFLMVVLFTVVGLALLVAYGLATQRAELTARVPHAIRGGAVALGVAIVLLAYPLWFALDGPAHLSGLPWPADPAGSQGLDLANFWQISFWDPKVISLIDGYAGPPMPDAGFLGVGALLVLGGGTVLWWRDRRLWFFGALGLVAVVLSLGLRTGTWTPWNILATVPIIREIQPSRIAAVITLCAAVMLGIVIDRVRDAVARRLGALAHRAPEHRRRAHLLGQTVADLAATAIAAVALVPMATAISGNVPATVQAVPPAPRWFTEAGRRAGAAVLLTFPVTGANGNLLVWQATDDFPYALATGAGPDTIPQRAGVERPGYVILSDASSPFPVLAPADQATVTAVRRAIAEWGVTDVVVPNPAVLTPRVGRSASTAWALGILTLAIGRAPQVTGGVWVWSDVSHPAAQRAITPAAFDRCTSAAHSSNSLSLAVSTCVLAESDPP